MKILKRKTLAALLALSLLASILPLGAQPALAAENAPTTLYVGNYQITNLNATTYLKAGSTQGSLVEGSENDWTVKYEPSSATLTLKNATIKGVSDNVNTVGAGIYAASSSGPVSLNIVLEGENKVSGGYGINVSSSGGDASLNISGSGSLTVSATATNGIGIFVQAQYDANLTIDGANVNAVVTETNGRGVELSTGQDGNPNLTIEVKGGSLQASGQPNGIIFFTNKNNTQANANLKVSGNAMVKTSGITTDADGSGSQGAVLTTEAGTGETGGIVWDGKNGTVYGDVTLQEDLEIGEGESLTIPEGSSLTVPEDKTITVESGGNLEGTPTGSGTVKIAPTITTESLPDGEVGTVYSQTLIATGDSTITWSVTSGTLPAGLTLDTSTGVISGTPTTDGTFTFTVKAENSVGNDSKKYELTIDPKPTVTVTGVKLDQTKLPLYTGESKTLTATVAPDNATNKTVTWSSNNEAVATVDQNGTVTAKSVGTAIITVTTTDGEKTATCTVTVTDKTYTISADTTALNFGSAYTGYAQPAAQTVILTNTGNQPVTLTQPASTNSFEVGTLSKTKLAAGDTATFTVQPKAGLAAGTYSDTITVSGSENVTVTISASFIVKSRPSYNPPTVSEKTTDAIKAADPGETVTVDLSSGSTKLDKDVFETLAGKDVTLVVDLGDGVSWTVNGSDIPEDADFTDIDLGVTMNSDGIPVDIINAITGEHGSVQLELAHDGAFGFTMTLTAPLGVKNAGYWANLYYFDEDAEQLTFETAAEIDADGSVSLPMSHASQYAIVIDDHSHATIDLPFSDVSADDWFYDPVVWIYNEGLMTGTSATMFEPNTSTTRAMIVSILARLENVTSAEAAGFADVTDEWYATAVNWAASVGVVNGYEDGTFKPKTAITREQLAAILMNYAQYKGQDVSARADLNGYTDQPSTWAEEAMQWAVAEELITGVTNDELQPQSSATRAQVAAILQRFLAE